MKSTFDALKNKENHRETLEKEYTWDEIKKKIFRVCECSKSIMIAMFDIRKKAFLNCSNTFKSILGYDSETILSEGWKFWYNLIDPREAEIVRKRINNFIFSANVSHSAIYLEYHMKSSGGDWRFIKHEVELFSIEGEKIALNYLYDFSEKEKIEDCLEIKTNPTYSKILLDVEISCREREVLNLIANGFSSKQIADKLYISNHTAISHRKSLIEKFKVNNTAQLIKKASKLIRL